MCRRTTGCPAMLSRRCIALSIPADAQPGTYPLEVGLYTSADQQRLPLLDASGNPIGDHVIIGSITVAP